MAEKQKDKEKARAASTDRRLSWSWKRLFGRDDSHVPPAPEEHPRPGLAHRLSRKVVPGLPRAGTFRRQQSELRDRLEPIKTLPDERRTASVDRRITNPCRGSAAAVADPPRLSAPELLETAGTIDTVLDSEVQDVGDTTGDEAREYVEVPKDVSNVDTQSVSTEAFDEMVLEELERRWILNLSMHFRDKSKREKFFVTFAETPSHWRRVTISLDYRNAPRGSLEEELQSTRFQRDKSARIYEAIRDSLQDIQFYDTVTNLKLQTENERLHVHVVEDVSEIISYPHVKSINHLNCRKVREDQLVFDSHLSGFVYKVTVDGETFIKKEIPGPDQVDEFLYEINALHQLSGSNSVIQFGGVVLDSKGQTVKGLLISFAEQGALVDVIYDGDGGLSWKRRERWAKQIVEGLSEIHEAGFVQGDFTLSNIVIDADDNAKIIDINRRGCPVGWEPPEVAALIESSQRISMYIGVKSDLFQLGMVLYALAMQQDEPENHRPLNLASFSAAKIPSYYFDICSRCLNDDPRRRSQAAVLLTIFPKIDENYEPSEAQSAPIIIDALYPKKAQSPSDEIDFPTRGRPRSRPHSTRYKRMENQDLSAIKPRPSLFLELEKIASEFPLPPSRTGSPDNTAGIGDSEMALEQHLEPQPKGSHKIESRSLSTPKSPDQNENTFAEAPDVKEIRDSGNRQTDCISEPVENTLNDMDGRPKTAKSNSNDEMPPQLRNDNSNIPLIAPEIQTGIAALDLQRDSPEHGPTKPDRKKPTVPEEPRKTAAAYGTSTKHLEELAGVGSVHMAHYDNPPAYLEDDLTTDLHEDTRYLEFG